MEKAKEKRESTRTEPGSDGKPSEEKIESVRKRLLKEYSEAWEELADH